MKIEVGKFYKTRVGHKVRIYSEPCRDEPDNTDKGAIDGKR